MTRQTRSQTGVITDVELIGNVKSALLAGQVLHAGNRGWAGTTTQAELLIDCEEDRTLRAVLVGMLRGPTGGARQPSSARASVPAF